MEFLIKLFWILNNCKAMIIILTQIENIKCKIYFNPVIVRSDILNFKIIFLEYEIQEMEFNREAWNTISAEEVEVVSACRKYSHGLKKQKDDVYLKYQNIHNGKVVEKYQAKNQYTITFIWISNNTSQWIKLKYCYSII